MHKAYKIKKIIEENSHITSIILDGKLDSDPGQFVMLWIPGIEEKPFAISYRGNNSFGITIEQKGRFTNHIKELKAGDKVGIRGPYGKGFSPKDNSIVVAGGLGMAPAMPLIKKIKNSIIIQGAKSKEFLLYMDNKELMDSIEKNKNKIIYCTDDGSFGIHSFTTELLKDMINKNIKSVFTCGPEIMIQKVFEICEEKNINCEASLERFFRCGIGLCGACVCGDQIVCKDGPVFSSEKLRRMKDFGKYAKLKTGKTVPLKEYFSYRSK